MFPLCLPHPSIANIGRSYKLNANTSTKYAFLMVDADYNKATPTNAILHTLYANLIAERLNSSESQNISLLSSSKSV
ncbi:uncharacterized protein TRUGW13939_03597 [Talaromyces rugulosus]|uniref:Uncharacterized protein n=1 Tax=Talaromyces rugulosus TaxID=121627 RepID=A0A7H8QRH5_TALRU|nr:uncharacterized protein TRUGW13939_03597 [Talaromyces rugulosus]QKX56492.1 hypothetical protein TRUGW13939_03597 [Talaromyces rugulosus]